MSSGGEDLPVLSDDAVVGIVVGTVVVFLIVAVIVATACFFWALNRWGSRDNVFADQRARRRQLRNNMGGRSMFFEDRHKIPVVKVSRRPSQKTFVYRRGSEAVTEGTLYSNTSADPKRITMDSPEGAINPVFAETAVGAMYHQHKVYYNTPAAKSDSDSDDSLNPYD